MGVRECCDPIMNTFQRKDGVYSNTKDRLCLAFMLLYNGVEEAASVPTYRTHKRQAQLQSLCSLPTPQTIHGAQKGVREGRGKAIVLHPVMSTHRQESVQQQI